MKKQTEVVKNLIRDKDFYKIQSCNYHYQLMQFKEKLISLKNKFNKIRQVNEQLQQKVNKLRTINEITLFQRRRHSLRLFSLAESTRYDISNTNILISPRKSIKDFDSELFINCREDLK